MRKMRWLLLLAVALVSFGYASAPVYGTIEGNVLTLNWATRDASGLNQFMVTGERMSGSAQLQERLQFNLARVK